MSGRLLIGDVREKLLELPAGSVHCCVTKDEQGRYQWDAGWLRAQYLDNMLSTYDIARIVGCDNKTVHSALVRFGIPTRPRGLNLSGSDNYMSIPGVVNPFAGRRHRPDSIEKIRASANRPKPWLRGKANGMYGRRGEDNSNWRGGLSPERQRVYGSAEWREAERIAISRDADTCQDCGATGKRGRRMHLHHIKSFTTHPHLRCDPDNLKLVCSKCHAKYRKKGGAANAR